MRKQNQIQKKLSREILQRDMWRVQLPSAVYWSCPNGRFKC